MATVGGLALPSYGRIATHVDLARRAFMPRAVAHIC